LTGEDVMPRPRSGGVGGGVEFIVGGKSGGNAALPSTLMALGLKPPDFAGGSRSATAPAAQKPAEIRGTVEEVLRSLTQPRTSIDAESRAAKSANNPATR
jgi:hypothetical protein